MSELEANSGSSGATDVARADDAKPDTAGETSVSATNNSDINAVSASGDAAARDGSGDAKPANIVLYSAARAKAEAERAEKAEADAFKAQTRWASRKVSRIVAVAAIAAAIGSLSGALATLGVTHVLQRNTPVAATADDAGLIKAALLQLETQLAAMKVNVDHATKVSAKVGERIDGFGGRIDTMEKTQTDAGQKIARIAEVQDKIRIAAASAVAAPQAAAPQTTAASVPMPQSAPPRLPSGQVAQLPSQPETTGSIAGPNNGSSEVKPKGDLKADYKATDKPAIVDGWVLTSVGRRGNAIVASRGGFYEIYPGDPLPGVGRVQDIRYQDGRWVVVTPKGLIVRR